MSLVFKIVGAPEWDAAEQEGVFSGASIDLIDGFIHLSAANQVEETAARHFSGQSDLLLVAYESAALGDKLIWEVSRGGAKFPHLYASLIPAEALWVKALPLGADGKHVFPALDG